MTDNVETEVAIDIPDHLTEGYRAYREWAVAMAGAGEPLPPGGAFILSKNAVLKACLLRLHRSLCAELKMPTSCVSISLEKNLHGALVPDISVDPPDGWLESSYHLPSGDRAQAFAESYIQSTIESQYGAFKLDLNARLVAFAVRRDDLVVSEIEDLLDEQADTGG